NVILGYINPTALLDGAMPIDAAAAGRVMQAQVATPLGLSLLDAAYGVHQLANASMIRAVKAVSTQRGRDPHKFTLFAFGGSGPSARRSNCRYARRRVSSRRRISCVSSRSSTPCTSGHTDIAPTT